MSHFTDTFILCELYKVTPNAENALVDTIIKSPYRNSPSVYRAFGEYDILALTKYSESSHLELHHDRYFPNIVEYSSFWAVELRTNTHCIDPHNYLLLFIVSIQLDFPKKSNQRYKYIESIIESLETLLTSISGVEITVTQSLGLDDLVLFVKTNTFEKFFELLFQIRSQYKSTLLYTTTIHAIPHPIDNFEIDDPLQDSDGKDATKTAQYLFTMDISCETNIEDDLLTNILTNYKDKYDCHYLLGSDDIRIEARNPISLNEIVRTIHNFRNSEQNSHFQTFTSLKFANPTPQLPKPDEVEPNTKIAVQLRGTIEKCWKVVESLQSANFEDKYLISRCQQLLLYFMSSTDDHKLRHATVAFDAILEFHLLQALLELEEDFHAKQQGPKQTSSALTISTYNVSQLVHLIYLGLRQRLDNRHTTTARLPEIPSIHGNGFNYLIAALSTLARSIYLELVNSGGDYGEWSGFIFCSQQRDLSLCTSSIISFPTESLLKPFDPIHGWMTITHEIAHDVWVQDELFNKSFIAREFFGDPSPGTISLNDLTAGNIYPDTQFPQEAEKTDLIEHFSEIFAHWFDFRHFYNSNTDLYFHCIWSAWSRIPNLDMDRAITNSLAVYITSNIKIFQERNLSKPDAVKLIHEQLEEHILQLTRLNYLPENPSNSIKQRISKTFERDTFLFIQILDDQYLNNSLIDSLWNKVDSSNLCVQISAIKSGKPLENATNIFQVYVQLLNEIRLNNVEDKISTRMAFIQSILLT